jgi:hypothetical protein
MNLLREYIRALLTESIDPKIMSMIDKLESKQFNNNVKVHVDDYGDGAGQVTIIDTTHHASSNLARVTWEKAAGRHKDHLGNCSGASVVEGSRASHGLGPLAYEVAIEVTGGLISDRMGVSDEAIAVWNYYAKNRPDIEIVQLDNLENKLTDTDFDNCDQEVAEYDLLTRDKQWIPSSLSKMYRKSGTPVMDELRKRGMLD